MYKWLVIYYQDAEFEIVAPDIIEARRIVEECRTKYHVGLVPYDLYKLGRCDYGE